MLARLALVAIVTGCAPTMSGIAHHAWHAIDTPHLHVETDLPLADAREQASLLERELQQTTYLLTELGGTTPDGLAVRVVLFDNCFERGQAAIGFWDNSSSRDVDSAPALELCKRSRTEAGAHTRYRLAF